MPMAITTFVGSGPRGATMPSARSASGSRASAGISPGRPGARTPATLGEADPGIQVAIEQVDGDVEDDEEDRDREYGALHERVVALDDRAQQHAADARDRKDLLDHDGAAEQLADLDAEERDHDDEPVLQDVTAHDDPRRQAFRTRGAHVIGPKHVQH